MYSEKNFLEREAYTEPEIRRSNLANVVLQLRSLGISIDEFEFIQSPLRSAFRGAYRTLFELGALSSADANANVTPFGREMSKLPMDVALSAVLLRSREKGVLQPAIIVCAALSLQDVRLIPQEETEKQKAREIHKQFGKYKSDFLLYIVIWNSFILELGEGSLNKLRKYCEKKYLHFLRCREWIDLYEQYCRLLNVGFQERVCPLESFHRDNLHLSLLYGFLGGIAKRSQEKSSYQLVSGRETFIFPGSSLYGQNMEWLMSAEIRETSRVYLTKNAEIRPEWILIAGKLFCTKRYYAPTWNRERGFVDALEEILFRGMVVSRGKRVDYSKINPAECSEIFFREAVVNMDMLRPFPFMEHNEKVLETLASMEKRLRRFGLVPSEDWLVDFYISKTENVCSIKSLKEFILRNTDAALRLKESDFVQEFSDFKMPSEKISDKLSLKNSSSKHSQKVKPELGGALETVRILDRILYGELVFDASRSCDGLTLKIPVEMLQKLTPAIFALEIERWRSWILESFFKELPREVSKKAKEIREKIDDVFCEFLEKEKEVSPVVALSKAIKQFGILKNESCLIYPEKEKHLNLHLSVMLSDGSTESIELSPEWGNYHYVQALKHLLVKEILFLPFGKFYLLCQNQKLTVVEKAEKDFYQELKKRIQKKLHPENTNLALDRISLLENCGAKIASQSNPSAKEEIVSALIASDWNPLQTERFSGLEFAKANRIKCFKDLSPELQSEDYVLRAGLSRLCYESALLGGNYFTALWNYLRQVTKSIRQGQKFSAELKRLANAVLNANSVYEILFLGIEFGKTEGLWQKEILELENSSSSPVKNLTVKDLREEFRPFLQSRLLREEDRRKVRDILLALEKTEIDSEEYIERYIMAKILFEKYSAKSIQKEEDMEIESIEQASLEKLKNRFGKI